MKSQEEGDENVWREVRVLTTKDVHKASVSVRTAGNILQACYGSTSTRLLNKLCYT